MEVLLILFLLALGILLIVKGGDWFVDAASWMAEISGIPKLIVGATVVSFATTLPELLVSSLAAFARRGVADATASDMSIGNAVGSVTANIALIMAIALIALPSLIKRKDYLLKAGLMIGAAVLLCVAGLCGRLTLVGSLLLLLIFAVAMWENVHLALTEMRASQEEKQRTPVTKKVLWLNILKFAAGAAGIIGGAQLLVDNGSKLAEMMGVPERIISVTVLAVGTSLPELVTTVTAIIKKQASLSAGNIIGANIIDLTLILPICALITGGSLPISPSMAYFDLPACLLVCLLVMLPALIRKKFERWQGISLLTVYAAYMVLTCGNFIAF